MSKTNKVYLNILKEIDRIIHADQLSPGDKLPSERELAERLNVGRSSVREALRSLELLDLIETRKGEGTFIVESGGHKLAEILASFFLRDIKARQDVVETRNIIETEAIRLACKRITSDQLNKLRDIIQQTVSKCAGGKYPIEEDYLFHKLLMEASHNRLMLNIWRPLVAFSKVALKVSLAQDESKIEHNIVEEHDAIYQALVSKDEPSAVASLQYHLKNSRL
ncbi:FadR/GntR family transcriptional regulator [Evansella cellulosilytica]|uniref:GntR domain protein n=1 Tax=Evansella cellulosilytica (strain ATCC 21833 / DSM 2522 / FERM P-1141 / JCM 9156 / N-4) TaxID=649639 RepID=E6U0M5_EVAC2|nr:FadR/GntR family transcriptional regulator [Evansella cellulosilytica]ADU31470.1 GntR domain protein [Evansella cellulosilytica DSM 2522]